MYPILTEFFGVSVYSYGFMIAIGAFGGVSYMALQGKRELGLTVDQANSLFIFIFVAAFLGGKLFLFFEDPSYYVQHPRKLLTGSGFVFYGSFLLAIPVMVWFFRKNKLPPYAMLDIMAVTTCIVHVFGRIGCFLAGCCYGKSTTAWLGVTFTHPACHAEPLHTALFPTQLMEAGYIFLVMVGLLWLRQKRSFYGQLFLSYMLLYGIGRFVLEYFRGDAERGFVIEGILSHAQLIALLVMMIVAIVYVR